MSEILNTYLLDNPDSLIPMDREAFYAEQIAAYQKNGKPTRAVDIVAIWGYPRLYGHDGNRPGASDTFHCAYYLE